MTGYSLSCQPMKTQPGFHLLGQKDPMERHAESEDKGPNLPLCCFHLCVLMCLLTCLAVIVGTVWPSCFKVLGLRREKLSRGTVVRKQPHQHRAETSESHLYKHITFPPV